MSKGIFLGLGSNIGDRQSHLQQACIMLSHLKNLLIEKESSIYETKPYGKTDQPVFFNMVLKVDTTYSPKELLCEIHRIEERMKRVRMEKWGPRTIDIDIIFFDQWIIADSDLTVPHYDLENRDFFLFPLMEIAPEFQHPVLKKTVADLAAELFVRNAQSVKSQK